MSVHGLHDTIAAIATPPGRGALAIVRLSGPRAGEILHRLCPELKGEPPPREQRLLRIHHPSTGELIDRGLVTWFPAPGSYTGDPTAEFTVHGGMVAPQLALGAMIDAGARPALPGEFTRRALLNGKLDLLQAEAVADLVEGTSPALHHAAIHQLERGLSSRIDELREELLRAQALIGYGIDFPDEDEPPVPPARIRTAIEAIVGRIDGLLVTAPQGALLREGALVALAGYPNVGKSSLFNALVGLDRAIVTDIPGTTRDAIEATILISGYPFRLIDTAGLRDTADSVESIGVDIARRYAAGADLLIYCHDLSAGDAIADTSFLSRADPATLIVVGTKADLVSGIDPAGESTSATSPELLPVSVVTGLGLPRLRQRLVDVAFGGVINRPLEAPLVTNQRHAKGLERARAEMQHFLDGSGAGLSLELLDTHLQSAAAELEGLIGAVTSDDILGAIFSRFCVGK